MTRTEIADHVEGAFHDNVPAGLAELTAHPARVPGRAACSYLVEVDGEGLSYERAVFDLAAFGRRTRSLDGDTAHWRFLAEVQDAGQRVEAREVLQTYFGDRLRCCIDRGLATHIAGKIRTVATVPLVTDDDLSLAYTPGVGRVCELIAADAQLGDDLTARANTVAIVTDGTAVLGFGDLGPAAALPVMEGKAALFVRLAGISAVPLCLNVTDTEQIVEIVAALAPSFGAINLEDIASPRCFEVERRLQDRLDIPVFHDDEHGTAIVVLAALRNALRVVGKCLDASRIVISGAGAAGTAVAKLLLAAGAIDVVVCAPVGVLHHDFPGGIPPHTRWLAEHTNPRRVTGGIRDALIGADAYIGVSGPGALPPDAVATMATDPVVFVLANPHPEVDPDAIVDVAAVIGTGSSERPNQINNVLAFPGVFRGALDSHARAITSTMVFAAADALTELGERHLAADHFLPKVLDPDVVPATAARVAQAWHAESGRSDSRPCDPT